MLTVVRNIVADVLSRNTGKPVLAKQNDANSRFIDVRIQENGKDMNIEAADKVTLNAQRPDKSTGMILGSVNADGTVRVELNSWLLEQPGTVSCDISIIKEDTTKLTTMTFYIEIEAAACCDGDIIETEDYIILVDLINKTQEACNIATEAANTAVATVQMCAGATKDAVSAANNAVSAANNANTAADAANLAASEAAGGRIFQIREHNNNGYLTFWVGTLEQYKSLPSIVTDRMYIITDEPTFEEDPDYPGCFYRVRDGEKEWQNPPMLLGEEYRTTEHWRGAPVYVKCVDCGTLPEFGQTKSVGYHQDNLVEQAIRVSGQLNYDVSSSSGGDCLPYYNPNLGLDIKITASQRTIKISNAPAVAITQELPACTVTVQVWYTKLAYVEVPKDEF